MSEKVDRIYLDGECRKKIEDTKIRNEAKWLDLYLLAMSLGFKEGVRIPSKNKSHISMNYFKPEEIALIYTVAIADCKKNKDIDEKSIFNIISNEKEVYKISEEYANGGIQLLLEEVDVSTSFKKIRLLYEKMIQDELKNLNLI